MVNIVTNKWVDHIVDEQTGDIIQQGSYFSQARMDNLELNAGYAARGMLNNKEALKASVPSGVLGLKAFTFYSTTPNKFKLLADTYHIDGDIIQLPDQDVTLADPPADDFVNVVGRTGERSDLVFLEMWRAKDENTNDLMINSRVRVVEDIDFATYEEGINHTTKVKAWGGVGYDIARAFTKSTTDPGLYVSGTGSEADKTALQSYDGYVYAIPIAKIERRNTGDYSDVNPNGAPKFLRVTPSGTVQVVDADVKGTINVPLSVDTSVFSVGMRFYPSTHSYPSDYEFEIVGVNPTSIDIKYIRVSSSATTWTAGYYYQLVGAPGIAYNDIVTPYRLIDLRHIVSLVGFNYTELTEKAIASILKTTLEAGKRKRVRPTYHGIRKTPIDANHVFYASLDTKIAEVGGAPVIDTYNRVLPTPTGYGLEANVYSAYDISFAVGSDPVTLDYFFNPKFNNFTGDIRTFGLCQSDYATLFTVGGRVSGTAYIITATVSGVGTAEFWVPIAILDTDISKHVRFVIGNGKIKLYLNGALYGESTNALFTLQGKVIGKVVIGNFNNLGNATNACNFVFSDVALSNIDRGDVFATLPKDFILGHADLAPAFSEQRTSYSDAITSQATTGIAKGIGSAHSLGIAKTQATPDTWANGDTVVVTGKAGELIAATPDVTFLNAGVATTVSGTWSGLGTSVATFTLGTNASLVNADLYVDYTLDISSGFGCLNVATNAFECEFNGTRLINRATVVKDDYALKIAGSVSENPNIEKTCVASTLKVPTDVAFTEVLQTDYDALEVLDGSLQTKSTTVNGEISQQLFSFDLIAMVEEKYGAIKAADKVQWVKDNLSKIVCTWYGYGSGPSGNLASLARWNEVTGTWNSVTVVTHTSNGVAKLEVNSVTGTPLANLIDDNGFVHYLAYAEASNGSIASVIYTDYLSVALEFAVAAGYTYFVPELPRRDAGQSNIIAIKRETKEVKVLFDAEETDGVITFVEEYPYQGISKTALGTALTDPKAVYVSDGTGADRNVSIDTTQHPFPVIALLPAAIDVYESEYIGDVITAPIGHATINSTISADVLLSTYKVGAGYYFPSIGKQTGIGTLSGRGRRGITSTPNAGRHCVGFQKISQEDMAPTGELTTGIVVTYALMVSDGQLYLVVATTNKRVMITESNFNTCIDVFRLEGRPLIKGV